MFLNIATISVILASLVPAMAADIQDLTKYCDVSKGWAYWNDNEILHANCETPAGWGHFVLDLGRCIANDDGTMSARKDGEFAMSCETFRFNGAKKTILSASCDSKNGMHSSEIDIAEFVKMVDGKHLECFGNAGKTYDTNSDSQAFIQENLPYQQKERNKAKGGQ